MSARTAQRRIAVFLGALILGWIGVASAQEESTAPEQPLTPAQQASQTAWKAAGAAMIHGPSTIDVRDQAKISLPDGYGFIPRKEAAEVMRVMGNTTDEQFVGLILPLAEEKRWFVAVDYIDSGYIKDDEAKDWKADELLDSLKEGTEAANEDRAKMGIPAIQVTRWIEKPAYDSRTHRLVWSAEVKLKEGADNDPGVNYNTYVLGRTGYISLNLITAEATVEEDKPAARQLLAAVNFNAGKTYADFKPSTDKVAAYGIAALIAGVAAKKLGLLAVIGVFIVKFAKVFALAAAGVGGGFWKWIRGRGGKNPGTPA